MFSRPQLYLSPVVQRLPLICVKQLLEEQIPRYYLLRSILKNFWVNCETMCFYWYNNSKLITLATNAFTTQLPDQLIFCCTKQGDLQLLLGRVTLSFLHKVQLLGFCQVAKLSYVDLQYDESVSSDNYFDYLYAVPCLFKWLIWFYLYRSTKLHVD